MGVPIVNNTESFDQDIMEGIFLSQTYRGRYYASLVGCDFAQEPVRYMASYFCAVLIAYSPQCMDLTTPSQPLCHNTCSGYVASMQTMANTPSLCSASAIRTTLSAAASNGSSASLAQIPSTVSTDPTTPIQLNPSWFCGLRMLSGTNTTIACVNGKSEPFCGYLDAETACEQGCATEECPKSPTRAKARGTGVPTASATASGATSLGSWLGNAGTPVTVAFYAAMGCAACIVSATLVLVAIRASGRYCPSRAKSSPDLKEDAQHGSGWHALPYTANPALSREPSTHTQRTLLVRNGSSSSGTLVDGAHGDAFRGGEPVALSPYGGNYAAVETVIDGSNIMSEPARKFSGRRRHRRPPSIVTTGSPVFSTCHVAGCTCGNVVSLSRGGPSAKGPAGACHGHEPMPAMAATRRASIHAQQGAQVLLPSVPTPTAPVVLLQRTGSHQLANPDSGSGEVAKYHQHGLHGYKRTSLGAAPVSLTSSGVGALVDGDDSEDEASPQPWRPAALATAAAANLSPDSPDMPVLPDVALPPPAVLHHPPHTPRERTSFSGQNRSPLGHAWTAPTARMSANNTQRPGSYYFQSPARSPTSERSTDTSSSTVDNQLSLYVSPRRRGPRVSIALTPGRGEKRASATSSQSPPPPPQHHQNSHRVLFQEQQHQRISRDLVPPGGSAGMPWAGPFSPDIGGSFAVDKKHQVQQQLFSPTIPLSGSIPRSETQSSLMPPPVDTRRAQLAYISEQSDELNVDIGDVVLVLEVYEDGWAHGYNWATRYSGVFPMAVFTEPPEAVSDLVVRVAHDYE
ncbi:hypothetical protein BC828DRAFT_7082 [Blastocladiella britannica]|nr:hypothetical protein BC828DRAFT_7082 [Blastocladiella britannica]